MTNQLSATADVWPHLWRAETPDAVEAPRASDGKYLATLPPFERMPKGQPRFGAVDLCERCGKRQGLHRFGDEACPNVAWQPGNGQSQYSKGWPASYTARTRACI